MSPGPFRPRWFDYECLPESRCAEPVPGKDGEVHRCTRTKGHPSDGHECWEPSPEDPSRWRLRAWTDREPK